MFPEPNERRNFPASETGSAYDDTDAENRLVAVTIIATGHRSEFGYDGLGRRVEIIEKDPDVTQTLQVTSDKKYLWDGVEIAEERDATGGIVQKRFYSQGFVDTDGTILFYTRDHLGSIRELTDSTQAVRARYDYDPYGRMTKVQGDKDSVFGYADYFWHAQSGLSLAVYRAYDQNTGRWISRDPLEEIGGVNLYRYANNSTINFLDSLGLSAEPATTPASVKVTYSPTAGDPVNKDLADVLDCFAKCVKLDIVVTAGKEDGHKGGKDGPHGKGEACDLGKGSNPKLTREEAERCFKQCFSSTAYGQEEQNDPKVGGTHFHFQMNHGAGNSTGFRSGIAPH
jgi:RHS repeat-associated protein